MERLRSEWGICLGLCVLIGLAFHGVAANGFLDWDDRQYVLENPIVKAGLSAEGVRRAFSEFFSSNWHPLTWLSHMLDMSLFGREAAGHHLVSVAIHAASACLLFLVLLRMVEAGARRSQATGPSRRAKREAPAIPRAEIDPFWPAAFVAAIFAVHPLRVESVAWIAQRKDVLSVFFWMLSLLAYVRYAERPSRPRMTAVFAAIAAGLLCKGTLVTLPFVLLLLDGWPLRRLSSWRWQDQRPLLLEKLPLFALVAAASVVTYAPKSAGGGLVELGQLPFADRIAQAIFAYIAYLGAFFWPAGLSPFYPPLDAALLELGAPVLAATAALLAVTALALWTLRESPFLAVGWFWYLGTLVPVIGLVRTGPHWLADRFTYVQVVGVSIAVAWGIARYWPRHPGRGPVLATLSTLAVTACVALTIQQVRFWHDTESLWRRALAVHEANHLAHSNLAAELLRQERFAEARNHARRATQVRPGYAPAHHNLGTALTRLGDDDAASAALERSLQIEPELTEAELTLADLQRRRGDPIAAVALFERALLREPGRASDANLRGAYANALAARWQLPDPDFDGVVESHRVALRIVPVWGAVANNLAWILATDSRAGAAEASEAVEWARLAVANEPTPRHVGTLAAALAAAGRFPAAIAAAEQAAAGATERGDDTLAADLHARLALYRTGRTSRQTLEPRARR